LIRAEVKSGSKNAVLINNIIKEGNCVPVEISVNLIKEAMEMHGWSTKRFLIDGFPRNQDNEDGW
jgi:UMP-CMP kinase